MSSVLHRRGAWVGGAVAMTAILAWAGSSGVVAQAPKAEGAPKMKQGAGGAVERGKYLVTGMGCHDCHTPWKVGANGPEPDMTRALSGHPADMALPPPPAPSGPWVAFIAATNTAFGGPWGVSHTANLTPDKETGLGTWTEQQFIDTIRNGRRQGRGRQLLPPMPWPMIRNMNDADLKAIFAYLQSLPPIKNKVPEPVLAGPPSQ